MPGNLNKEAKTTWSATSSKPHYACVREKELWREKKREREETYTCFREEELVLYNGWETVEENEK